jgi:iron complex transport system substrate-binding protein
MFYLTKRNYKSKFTAILQAVFLCLILSESLLWAGNIDIKSVNRIISTSPSITETLFSLGLGHRVVGVTDFCEYPPEACQLPSIGGMTNPNIEALVSLKPDLVIHQSNSDRMAKNIETLGIPSMEITMDTLDDILSSIKFLGSTLDDVKVSEQLLKKLTDGINFYKNKLEGISSKETLLLLGDSSDPGRDLYATGPGTFLHELLEISGGKNILHSSMPKYPRLSKEYIIEKSPEVIIEAGPKSRLTQEQVQERLRGWKRFPSIRAVQTGKVYYIGADYMLIPGPRFLNILEQFSRVMHPDIFNGSLDPEFAKVESVQ